MTGFLSEVLLMTITAAVACLVVRCVVPPALRAVHAMLADGLSAVAAGLLLPEFWISSAQRRRGARPTPASYGYSGVVSSSCRLGHALLRRVTRGLVVAARTAPLPLIFIVGAALYIELLW